MLIFDTECFPNYFLLSTLDYDTGAIAHFELSPDSSAFQAKEILRLFKNNTVCGFNINSYDIPILIYALQGKGNEKIKALSDDIILNHAPSWEIYKKYGIVVPGAWDTVDLFSVAPGKASLKALGGRIGVQKLQDLPFSPDTIITKDQRTTIRDYCTNDLVLTKALYNALAPEIALRVEMSKDYGIDLRSKSDAQVAEAVIKSELNKITGKEYYKPDSNKLPTSVHVKSPLFISFESKELQDLYFRVLKEPFSINSLGRIDLPKWLADTEITIGESQYSMKIGGLHSTEKKQCLRAEKGYRISDLDCVSYYPSIILGQQLVPKSLGLPFLKVYQSLVTRRIEAKKSGDKKTAASLKIAINASYGKLGSLYSPLYAPELLIQTTITGQLALLMLIEQMEQHGIKIKSANTDGILAYYREDQTDALEEVAFNWEMTTGFELEQANYSIIAARDVNNYVCIDTSGKIKSKGAFAPPFYAKENASGGDLMKSPDRYIIPLSVINHLKSGIPIEETILSCKDVRHFTALRKVTGGAMWRGESVGKTVRYYNSSEISQDECLIYAVNGNKVPTTSGCRPMMDLPDELPSDIDYDFYIESAYDLLKATGALI